MQTPAMDGDAEERALPKEARAAPTAEGGDTSNADALCGLALLSAVVNGGELDPGGGEGRSRGRV